MGPPDHLLDHLPDHLPTRLLARLLAWLCVLVLLLSAATAAQACGPYRLAFRVQPGVYEPLPDGTAQGSDVDAVAELARRSGCRIETQWLSQAAAWKAFEEGYVDLLPSTLLLAERERVAEIVPVISGRIVLLVQADQAQRTPTLAALTADPQARVLVQRGAAYPAPVQQWLQSEALRGRVSEAADLMAALRALAGGRAVAMPIYPLLVRPGLLPDLSRYQVLNPWPDVELTGGLAMSRRTVSEADRALLRKSLVAMVRDGSLQRIVERHFDPTLARQQLKFLVSP